MSSELFGVEIEIAFGDVPPRQSGYDIVINAIQQQGILVNDTRHTHAGHHHEKWTVKFDSSIGEPGCEVVSPPLDFNDPLQREQVNKVMFALQLAGCQTSESAGIHVHVAAGDLDGKQLAAICRFVWKFEDMIFRLASSGWDHLRRSTFYRNTHADYGLDGYSKPLQEEMVKRMTKVRQMDQLLPAWRNNTWETEGDRYQVVNLNSWWMRSTVEFRPFNSSVSADRVQAYIALCVAIVRDARNGQSRSTAKHYPLGYMYENPEKAQALFLRFQQVMTTASGDGNKSKMKTSGRLMSREDWKLILRCYRDSVALPPIQGRR